MRIDYFTYMSTVYTSSSIGAHEFVLHLVSGMTDYYKCEKKQLPLVLLLGLALLTREI